MTCETCNFFTRDTVGDGTGIGKCQQYDDYRAKTNVLGNLQVARVKLGNTYDNDVFWPGSGVNCEKFELA